MTRRPSYRRRLGFHATMWLMAFGAILAYAVITASHAHSTPITYPVDVCGELRHHTSLTTIETGLEAWGLSPRAAGIYTGNAVRMLCPDLVGYVTGQLV